VDNEVGDREKPYRENNFFDIFLLYKVRKEIIQ
jgi:hypothetical protein